MSVKPEFITIQENPPTVEIMYDGRYALATVRPAQLGYVRLDWTTLDGTRDHCVRKIQDVIGAIERKEAVSV